MWREITIARVIGVGLVVVGSFIEAFFGEATPDEDAITLNVGQEFRYSFEATDGLQTVLLIVPSSPDRRAASPIFADRGMYNNDIEVEVQSGGMRGRIRSDGDIEYRMFRQETKSGEEWELRGTITRVGELEGVQGRLTLKRIAAAAAVKPVLWRFGGFGLMALGALVIGLSIRGRRRAGDLAIEHVSGRLRF